VPAVIQWKATTSRRLSAAPDSVLSYTAAMMTPLKYSGILLAAWASPLVARGGTPGLPSAYPTAPRPVGTSSATCAQAPATLSGTPHSSTYLLHRSSAQPLAMRLLSGTLTSVRTTTPTTHAQGRRFAPSSLKRWGALAPMQYSFSANPPTPPFSTPGTSVTHGLPTCTAIFLWCSVATCPSCLLLLASTPPARDLAGSAAHRTPLQRFCTERFAHVLHVAGPCFWPACPGWSCRIRACFAFQLCSVVLIAFRSCLPSMLALQQSPLFMRTCVLSGCP
jgi:hypothetical protein